MRTRNVLQSKARNSLRFIHAIGCPFSGLKWPMPTESSTFRCATLHLCMPRRYLSSILTRAMQKFGPSAFQHVRV